MAVLTNFQALINCLVLFICFSTILKRRFPSLVQQREGIYSIIYKSTVIGERLSFYVSLCCLYIFLSKLLSFFRN